MPNRRTNNITGLTPPYPHHLKLIDVQGINSRIRQGNPIPHKSWFWPDSKEESALCDCPKLEVQPYHYLFFYASQLYHFNSLVPEFSNILKVLLAVFRIRIRIKFVSWIRIRIPDVDPDPAADKISSKSQNNSSHLELFD
jgi:hypothetical protein